MRPLDGLQPRVARAAAFLLEAGHTTPVAIGMAHRAFGRGPVPASGRRVSYHMSPQETDGLVRQLQARRVLVEGMLLTLAGDDVREGAVLSAHALVEADAAGRSPRLHIGGGAASVDQVHAAQARLLAEMHELDAMVEAALPKADETLSMLAAGPKANPRVVHLQNKLNALGHHVQADGVFGRMTHEAVKDFQTKLDLDPTGEVDDKTDEALRNGGKLKPSEDEKQARDHGMALAQLARDKPSEKKTEASKKDADGDSKPRTRSVTVKLTEGKLSAADRRKLPSSAFVFPKKRSYPIHDLSHARNALARAAGKPEEGAVKAAVYKKYPHLRHAQEADTKADFPADQIPSVCPQCGAPVRQRTATCQRGHHVAAAR